MSLKGYHGWNYTYAQQFGSRWHSLKLSLNKQNTQLAIVPKLQSQSSCTPTSLKARISLFPYCYWIINTNEQTQETESSKEDKNQIKKCSHPEYIFINLRDTYFIDPASALASFCLKIEANDRILDACAAPGGKSLLIASQLFSNYLCTNFSSDNLQKHPLLVCNENSKIRMKRLEQNIISHLPSELFKMGLIQFTNEDASSSNCFDRFSPFTKILLDAACSSDKFLITENFSAFSKWSTGVVKKNSKKQKHMLIAMMDLLSPSGYLLYCTCALSALENDKVIESALKSSRHHFKVVPLFSNEELELYKIKKIPLNNYIPFVTEDDKICLTELCFNLEETNFGAYILPDRSNCGPLYLSKLYKLPTKDY